MACGWGATLCPNSAGGLQFLASLSVSPGAHRHFIGGSDTRCVFDDKNYIAVAVYLQSLQDFTFQ
jgi:hypothetical protein